VSPDARPARRAFGVALILLAAGGLLLLVGYGRAWAHAAVPLVAGVDGATKQVDVSGRELLPLAAASGWLVLAALAGLVATRSWGRTAVAIVAVIAGLAGAGGAVAFAVGPGRLVESAVGSTSIDVTLAWIVALAGGVLTLLGAGWAVARGRGWPVMGARYERATPRTARSDWDLQDMGKDPTDDLVE
jgi:hypothetical protein